MDNNFCTTSLTSLIVDHVLTVMGRFLECGSDTSLTNSLRSGPMKESDDRLGLFFVDVDDAKEE